MIDEHSLEAGPYRGLRAFGDSDLDALLFFGRERERAVLVANLLAARLTVLYGPSGAGKSSLLRAGVVHELRGRSDRGRSAARVVVHERWAGDPCAAVAAAIEEACGSVGPAAGLADVAAAATHRIGGPLYLILDQFEEYLLYHGAGPLAEALPQLLEPTLEVNVLLSLRDDALSQLDVFKTAIPGLFANVLRLDRLDREGGRRAIVAPLEPFGELTGRPVTIEPPLVEEVLDQVAVGQLEPSERAAGSARPGQIEAPYLQLVLERLWQEERAEGSATLRLATLHRLGGAEAIVRDHLESALSGLADRQLDAAAAVLNQLVTPSGTKVAHRPRDLAEYATLPLDELEPVLTTLARERILRTIEARGSEPERCEIFHDVLAGPVAAWRSGWAVERERRAAARQRRRLLVLSGAALAALVVVIAIAVFALVQRSHARSDARRAHARALATSALAELPVDGRTALRLALQAARLAPSEQTEDVLRTALTGSHERAAVELGGSVQSASFDPSGTHLLVASTNGKVRMLDRDGRLLWARRTAAPLVSAFFMPDGRSVMAAGGSEVHIWDAAGGRELRKLTVPDEIGSVGVASVPASSGGLLLVGLPGRIELVPLIPAAGKAGDLRTSGTPVSLQASRNGRLLAAIVRDAAGRERALVFQLRARQLLRVLPGRGLKAIAFSPGGRFLATGSSDKNARIWNPRNGRLLHVLPHRGWVVSLAYSPDGSQLATASVDGATRVWDTRSGVRLLILAGPIGAINSVAFSASGRFLLAGTSDRTARVYDDENGKELAVLTGNRDAVTTATFSPDEQLALTGGNDGTARIWDPGVAEQLHAIDHEQGAVRQATISPDGRLLLIVREHDLHLRLARTNALVASLDAGAAKVVSAAFSPDSRLIAVALSGGVVRILRGGRTVARLETGGSGAMAFAGRDRLITAGSDRLVLWQLPSGRQLRTVAVGRSVTALAASNDGRVVATLARGGEVRLWNPETGASLGRLSRPAERVALSPDGQRLLTSWGKNGLLWATDDRRLLHILRGHSGDLTSAVFAADSDLLVTGSLDHDARVWSVSDGRLISVLRGHFSQIYGVDASPDGCWVVTAGLLTVGVWRSTTGRALFFLRGPTGTLTGVSFGSDGGMILTGSEDGSAYLYRCDVCGSLSSLETLAAQRLVVPQRAAS
ncbi:MAG: nSTAND1 domain-containing NTPase [Gaiellaceae bacterium]